MEKENKRSRADGSKTLWRDGRHTNMEKENKRRRADGSKNLVERWKTQMWWGVKTDWPLLLGRGVVPSPRCVSDSNIPLVLLYRSVRLPRRLFFFPPSHLWSGPIVHWFMSCPRRLQHAERGREGGGSGGASSRSIDEHPEEEEKWLCAVAYA